MKKFKMMFATLMLGMAIVGGFQAHEYANMSTTETLLLENVEALASYEYKVGSTWYMFEPTCSSGGGGTCEVAANKTCPFSYSTYSNGTFIQSATITCPVQKTTN